MWASTINLGARYYPIKMYLIHKKRWSYENVCKITDKSRICMPKCVKNEKKCRKKREFWICFAGQRGVRQGERTERRHTEVQRDYWIYVMMPLDSQYLAYTFDRASESCEIAGRSAFFGLCSAALRSFYDSCLDYKWRRSGESERENVGELDALDMVLFPENENRFE